MGTLLAHTLSSPLFKWELGMEQGPCKGDLERI